MFTHVNNRTNIHVCINTNITYTQQEPPWCCKKPFTCCQLKPERCPIRLESSTDVSKMVRLFSGQKAVQPPKRQKAVSKTVSLWRRANRFVFFSEKISFPFFGCISLGFWFFVLISLCFWCVWYQLRSLMIARTSGGHCSRKCYRILNQPGCLVHTKQLHAAKAAVGAA